MAVLGSAAACGVLAPGKLLPSSGVCANSLAKPLLFFFANASMSAVADPTWEQLYI